MARRKKAPRHLPGCDCRPCVAKRAAARVHKATKIPHTCHARRCDTVVPRAMLMCRRHWAMVPATLKHQVLVHYQTGQELGAVRPSVAYLKAAGDAIESVERSRQVPLFEGAP